MLTALSLWAVAPLSALAEPPRRAGRGPASAVYVSPNGSDANRGDSLDAPFLTLQHAEYVARGVSTKTIYLMGGTFAHERRRLYLGPEVRRRDLGGLSGADRAGAGRRRDGGRRVRRPGLEHQFSPAGTIQNFAHKGINVPKQVTNVWIDSNTFDNIASDA